MQEEIAKSDLIIAELNMTIEDLRDYNVKLEGDISTKRLPVSDGEESNKNSNLSTTHQLGLDRSDEWLNLEIEVARLQKEIADRDIVIRAQKEALDRTLAKGGGVTPRQVSLAGAVKQALDINVREMARLYNETLQLCRTISSASNSSAGSDLGCGMNSQEKEYYEKTLEELDRKHYELIEELGFRHTQEIHTLRSDYEVLLELAVKEKEEEMRNTIIENGELEELAEQVENYSEELKRKDKEIRKLEETISYLMEDLNNLEKNRRESVVPQILIEDPEGKQCCVECERREELTDELSSQLEQLEETSKREINELQDLLQEMMEKEGSKGETADNTDDLMIKQTRKHLKLEKHEAVNLAEVRTFYNSLFERLANFDKKFSHLKASRTSLREDVQNMTRELDDTCQEIRIIVNNLQTEPQTCTSATQTVALNTEKLSVNSAYNSIDKEQYIKLKEREAQHIKDIFELKVKLKEMEAKVSHLKSKTQFNPPKIEFTLEDPNLEKKLSQLVQNKDEELRQARRLHGQNLATMRKRHDKIVSHMKENIDRLELTVQELLHPGVKRSKNMALPSLPSTQGDNYIIMQQAFLSSSPKDSNALIQYKYAV